MLSKSKFKLIYTRTQTFSAFWRYFCQRITEDPVSEQRFFKKIELFFC